MAEICNPRCALSVGAVILAAGAASRIGNRPKCLLQLHGEPLIQRMVRAALDSGITHIAVVLGHYAEQIEPVVTSFPVTLVHNLTPDAGQNASLHCGLRALPSSLDATMVMLADQPLIDTKAIGDLIEAYQHRPAACDVLVPAFNGLPGNPVLFSNTVSHAILQRDDAFGCKQWQHENRERVYRWPTSNENYRIDIDSMEDMKIFELHTGLPLRWP